MRVIAHHPLPDGLLGGIADRRIWLHSGLDEAGRRSTLAHEIVHLERRRRPAESRGCGIEGSQGEQTARAYDRREERLVDAIAARRLIDLDHLIDAVKWSRNPAEIAAHLGVDGAMLRSRWSGLGTEERRAIARGLELSGTFHE